MFQSDLIDLTILSPLISLIVMIFLLVLSFVLYFKGVKNNSVFIFIIFIFMIGIGTMSIQNAILPFTPLIQAFFILIQAFLTLVCVVDVSTKKRRK